MSSINIKINEGQVSANIQDSIFTLKDLYKKDADVVIVNGFPLKEDKAIKENDKITFIKKGEKLSYEQVESVIMARHTPLVYERLKGAKVGIAGLGGLGSNIVSMLARIGVGELVIVDYDVVEPSNLNRQNYFINQLGEFKTDATIKNIKMINPFIKVEKIDAFLDKTNCVEIFKDCDVVIEAFDDAKCKAELVNTLLTKSKKIIVSGSGMAGIYPSNTIKTKRVNSRFYVCGDEASEAREFCGLMSTRVNIAAGHMANTAVRIILGEIDNGGEL
ncbi:MAG: sulfur carrier protein ThiS adenylyltransferase ThiF [Sarcina sp.]